MDSKTCSVPDCDGKHKALGYCFKHYKRWTRGTLDQPRRYVHVPKNVHDPRAWPYEVMKIDGQWHRRPTGSGDSWEYIVWEDGRKIRAEW